MKLQYHIFQVLEAKKIPNFFDKIHQKNATVAIMGAIGDANLMTKHGLAGEICVF